MEKIKPRLYQLTIALSLISLILALVSSGKQREFFYIAIYVSIIGLAFEYKKITLRPFTIALPILLIGLLNSAGIYSMSIITRDSTFTATISVPAKN